jgi:rod shape-determining protein MreB
MFSFLRSYFSNDLAIDLGTANTLIYVRSPGIVLDEPSVVAIRPKAARTPRRPSRPSARKPRRCSARRPAAITVIRPMKDGVIADFTVTEQMLKQFIKKVHDSRCFSHRRGSSSACPRGRPRSSGAPFASRQSAPVPARCF